MGMMAAITTAYASGAFIITLRLTVQISPASLITSMSNIRTNMDYFGGDYDEFCAIADPGDAAKLFFAVTMSAALANLHAPPTPKPLLSGYKQNNQREGDLL